MYMYEEDLFNINRNFMMHFVQKHVDQPNQNENRTNLLWEDFRIKKQNKKVAVGLSQVKSVFCDPRVSKRRQIFALMKTT